MLGSRVWPTFCHRKRVCLLTDQAYSLSMPNQISTFTRNAPTSTRILLVVPLPRLGFHLLIHHWTLMSGLVSKRLHIQVLIDC